MKNLLVLFQMKNYGDMKQKKKTNEKLKGKKHKNKVNILWNQM